MKNISIIFIIIILLSGCTSKETQKDLVVNVPEQVVTSSLTESLSGSVSKSIINNKPIPITGTILIYADQQYYNILKDDPNCSNDTDNTAGALAISCKGIVGYNHLYDIPSLKLQYLYESERLASQTLSGIDNFLFTTGGVNIVTSGNMMYEDFQNTNKYIKNPIILHHKKLNDTPQDIIDSLVKQGCEISVVTGNSFSGYIQYYIDVFKNINIDNYTGTFNLCIPEFKGDLMNSNWRFIFSPEPKDYYYVIGDPGASNGLPTYTSTSLKLFVE